MHTLKVFIVYTIKLTVYMVLKGGGLYRAKFGCSGHALFPKLQPSTHITGTPTEL